MHYITPATKSTKVHGHHITRAQLSTTHSIDQINNIRTSNPYLSLSEVNYKQYLQPKSTEVHMNHASQAQLPSTHSSYQINDIGTSMHKRNCHQHSTAKNTTPRIHHTSSASLALSSSFSPWRSPPSHTHYLAPYSNPREVFYPLSYFLSLCQDYAYSSPDERPKDINSTPCS